MSDWHYMRLTGKKGDSGSELMVLYSAQNSVSPNDDPDRDYWHTSFQPTDFFMCTKSEDSELWGNIMKIVGEGLTVQYSADGSTYWHNPPAVATDKYMRQKMDSDSSWGAVKKIVGEDGQPGENAVVITGLTPPNPAGSYDKEVGNYNGVLYQWNSTTNKWDRMDAVTNAELSTSASTTLNSAKDYADTKKAEAISAANANVSTYTPRYIGAYPTAPTASDYNKGDWYLNTTNKTLHINSGSAWGNALTYTNENKQYFEAAANDIMTYADTTDGNNAISQFAVAFIQHLFAKNITITSGGCIQTNNYVAGKTGFKINYDGSSEFNNTKVRGTLDLANFKSFPTQIGNSFYPAGTRVDNWGYIITSEYVDMYGNIYKEGILDVSGTIGGQSFERITMNRTDAKATSCTFTFRCIDSSENVVYQKSTSAITFAFLYLTIDEDMMIQRTSSCVINVPETKREYSDEVWNDKGTLRTSKRLNSYSSPFRSKFTRLRNSSIGNNTKYFVLDRGSGKPSSIPNDVSNIDWFEYFEEEDLVIGGSTSEGTENIKMVLISMHTYDRNTIGWFIDSDVLSYRYTIQLLPPGESYPEIQVMRTSNESRQATNTFTIPVKSWFSVRQSASKDNDDLQITVLGYYHI